VCAPENDDAGVLGNFLPQKIERQLGIAVVRVADVGALAEQGVCFIEKEP
jgi:hypothetical protein